MNMILVIERQNKILPSIFKAAGYLNRYHSAHSKRPKESTERKERKGGKSGQDIVNPF